MNQSPDEIICPRCQGFNTQQTDEGVFIDEEYQALWYCYDCDLGYLNIYRLAEQSTDGIEGPSWVG